MHVLLVYIGWGLLYVFVIHPEQHPSWPNNSKQHKLSWCLCICLLAYIKAWKCHILRVWPVFSGHSRRIRHPVQPKPAKIGQNYPKLLVAKVDDLPHQTFAKVCRKTAKIRQSYLFVRCSMISSFWLTENKTVSLFSCSSWRKWLQGFYGCQGCKAARFDEPPGFEIVVLFDESPQSLFIKFLKWLKVGPRIFSLLHLGAKTVHWKQISCCLKSLHLQLAQSFRAKEALCYWCLHLWRVLVGRCTFSSQSPNH